MKYVSYIRVSTKGQGRSGLGLEAQRRDIEIFMKHFAEAGSEIIAEFQDIESGTITDRENLVKACEMCKEAGAVLLVAKLDRLSRDLEQIAGMIKRVKFVVAETPHADKMQLQMRGVWAEQERDFISLRTKAALAVKKEQGVKLGAAAHKEANKPQHLKRQPKAAIEFAKTFEKELKIMRGLGLTYDQISVNLNTSGHKTREGSSFSKKQVQRMCQRLQIK